MGSAWEVVGLVAVCTLAGSVLALGLLRALSRRPDNLGLREGRLAPCPGRPNCICSQAPPGSPEHIEPLRLTSPVEERMGRLKAVLSSWPRTTVVTATDDYIHAECRSRLFRFIDDVELALDRAAGVIHCRSASRVGHSDLGVNRHRIEAIRKALTLTE